MVINTHANIIFRWFDALEIYSYYLLLNLVFPRMYFVIQCTTDIKIREANTDTAEQEEKNMAWDLCNKNRKWQLISTTTATFEQQNNSFGTVISHKCIFEVSGSLSIRILDDHLFFFPQKLWLLSHMKQSSRNNKHQQYILAT